MTTKTVNICHDCLKTWPGRVRASKKNDDWTLQSCANCHKRTWCRPAEASENLKMLCEACYLARTGLRDFEDYRQEQAVCAACSSPATCIGLRVSTAAAPAAGAHQGSGQYADGYKVLKFALQAILERGELDRNTAVGIELALETAEKMVEP